MSNRATSLAIELRHEIDRTHLAIALLKNLDRRLSIETGLPVSLAEDPLSSVVLGTGKMLSDFNLLKRVKWDNTLTSGM